MHVTQVLLKKQRYQSHVLTQYLYFYSSMSFGYFFNTLVLSFVLADSMSLLQRNPQSSSIKQLKQMVPRFVQASERE